jgi:hypothetical protein
MLPAYLLPALGAALRQASEQYFTSSQFFAQLLRQLISLPQTVHGLLGKYDLLPLNDCGALVKTCLNPSEAGFGCANP